MTSHNESLKLPLDCEAHYYDRFITEDDCKAIFEFIYKHCHLERQKVTLSDGKSYKLNRATLVFTDEETAKLGIIPKTWGDNVPIIIWPEPISKIKEKIEKLTGKKYNICLCNFYANGKRNIGWHSDLEEYGSLSSIASISIGCPRKFSFRKISNLNDIYSIILQNGSLLIMGENCQERYQHCVVPDNDISDPRINLTFRLFDIARYSHK